MAAEETCPELGFRGGLVVQVVSGLVSPWSVGLGTGWGVLFGCGLLDSELVAGVGFAVA